MPRKATARRAMAPGAGQKRQGGNSAKPTGKQVTKSTENKVKGDVVGNKGPKLERMTLGSALISLLKERRGGDLEFNSAPGVHRELMMDTSIKERAGYPLVRAKGSVDPAKWRCNDGQEIIVDFKRFSFLPDDWGQGVKITIPNGRSFDKNGERTKGGGTYTVMISPEGKVFYHRKDASEFAGKPFDIDAGFNGQVRLAKLKANETVQLVRRQIRELSGPEGGSKIGTDSDNSFFALLSPAERACLPKKEEMYFAVVSARRATNPKTVQDLFAVQSQCLDAGVTPTWYVDAESLDSYRKLGLKAVVGGRLTPARNLALADARRQRKVCVQLSDDITAWEYRHGPPPTEKTDDACNKAHAEAKRYILTPLAAAQFILAKMRGAEGHPKPHLGGVYMLGSCSRAFASDPFPRRHFIIGDFFVADTAKELRVKFDDEMTLKEDYDFTCSHISTYGSVMRCNRMTLNVKHYSNGGGAVSTRDGKGAAEQRNIAVLTRKWPGMFRPNPKRKNEVILKWKVEKGQTKAAANAEDVEDEEDDDAHQGLVAEPSKAAPGKKSKLGGGNKEEAVASKKSAATTRVQKPAAGAPRVKRDAVFKNAQNKAAANVKDVEDEGVDDNQGWIAGSSKATPGKKSKCGGGAKDEAVASKTAAATTRVKKIAAGSRSSAVTPRVKRDAVLKKAAANVEDVEDEGDDEENHGLVESSSKATPGKKSKPCFGAKHGSVAVKKSAATRVQKAASGARSSSAVTPRVKRDAVLKKGKKANLQAKGWVPPVVPQRSRAERAADRHGRHSSA